MLPRGISEHKSIVKQDYLCIQSRNKSFLNEQQYCNVKTKQYIINIFIYGPYTLYGKRHMHKLSRTIPVVFVVSKCQTFPQFYKPFFS